MSMTAVTRPTLCIIGLNYTRTIVLCTSVYEHRYNYCCMRSAFCQCISNGCRPYHMKQIPLQNIQSQILCKTFSSFSFKQKVQHMLVLGTFFLITAQQLHFVYYIFLQPISCTNISICSLSKLHFAARSKLKAS